MGINEILQRTDNLLDKIVQEAKKKCGDDYDKYRMVYMMFPGYKKVRINNDCNGEITVQISDIKDSFNYLWLKKGRFILNSSFSMADGSHKVVHLDSDQSDNLNEYYDVLNRLLDDLNIRTLIYDKERTTSVDNSINEGYISEELDSRCRNMGLSEKKLYPTIQATVDFWSLVLADYFVSEGISIVDDEEAKRKVTRFKDFLGDEIVEEMVNDMYGASIDCHQLLSDYEYEMNQKDSPHYSSNWIGNPVSRAIDHIAVPLNSFLAYYKENWEKGINGRAAKSVTTLGGAFPIENIEKFVMIPSNIKKKLENLSYKILTYVHENNLITNDKDIYDLITIMVRFWHWITPSIIKFSVIGYSIPIDDDEICRIVANSDDKSWRFIDITKTIREYDTSNKLTDSDPIVIR